MTTDESNPATDALDDAADCIAQAIGDIDAGFAARLGKPAKEIGQVKKRARAFARRIAAGKLAPFYPTKG